MKSIYLLPLFLIFAFANETTVGAQGDSNTQFLALLSGRLASNVREIDVPVETGVLRLQFNVKFSGELDLKVITPLGNPLNLSEPNIIVMDSKDGRSITLWDPKPGKWKMRLSGSGTFNAFAAAQGEIVVCCVQFIDRTGVFAIERFQPTRGVQQQAQAFTSGYSIETIEFQMIDEEGQLIGPIKFRQTDYSNATGFTMFIDIPNLDFRIRARGRDTSGKEFQRVINWLIRPQPPDVPGANSENSPQLVPHTQFRQSDREAIVGEQPIIRAQIVSWSDEHLMTERGNPIGIRLKYSISVPAEGFYSLYPHLYPESINTGVAAALSMRVHRASVDPLPNGMENQDQLFFGARATFRPGQVYNFTIDLIPSFVNYIDHKKEFCIQRKAYSQQGNRERFERQVTSRLKLRYRFTLTGTNLDRPQPSLTHNTYVPLVWYQSYLKEGAVDCQ
ncbi:MAG: hypothetical protein L0220_00740 [Acidobacteria bacterium]|nr:hypothetical protein [Acidobacteriota bacterium]